MIPKEAIEKAMREGWAPCDVGEPPYTIVVQDDGVWFKTKAGTGEDCYIFATTIALHPPFWQHLAKALKRKDWQTLAHEFVDVVLTDNEDNIEKFWKDLLSVRISPMYSTALMQFRQYRVPSR